MEVDFKGIERTNSTIQNLIDLLQNSNNSQLWEHMGLKVEIDPTIDYNFENILVRWLDVEEGFNDKIIVYSLNQFQSLFKAIT